ncbi:MAG TPA: ribonuclease P protein component [Jatrophihabitans sp.]|uniref:ribonuclease P protein component n=1 Tax=Jatrophihabitans sp. TaxID=1932789 RepID=UPI002F0F68BC
MLPAAHRLRSAADFTAVTRRGRRVRSGSVVVYLLTDPAEPAASRVGLVVGKAVGASVVRHQVSRRLRAQLQDRLDRIPSGAKLVVRALPETAKASSAVLGHDLSRALDKLGAHPAHRSGAVSAPTSKLSHSPGWSGSSR